MRRNIYIVYATHDPKDGFFVVAADHEEQAEAATAPTGYFQRGGVEKIPGAFADTEQPSVLWGSRCGEKAGS